TKDGRSSPGTAGPPPAVLGKDRGGSSQSHWPGFARPADLLGRRPISTRRAARHAHLNEDFDQPLAPVATLIAARSWRAKPATGKSATPSTKIRSLIAFLTRRGRILWYSGELYQFCATAMLANSIRTTETGHAPSRTRTSPCASHFPPYGLTVRSTC